MKTEKPDYHCKLCGQEVPKLFRICVDCSKLNVTQHLKLTNLSQGIGVKGWS